MTDTSNEILAEMNTSKGVINIRLYPQQAPVTVANFVNLASRGFYDGLSFHSVIDDFMIQGGGFEPGMQQKKVNDAVQNEAANGLKNEQYTR